jgi:SAM-dependent methyltransferase
MNILAFIFLLFLGTFAYAGVRAAPWFPTWSRDINRFLKLADIKPGQKFYDLGCGDGKLVFAAAKAGADATGYEISLLPYLIAKVKSFYIKNSRIEFRDFWNQNFSDADIVYVFLTPKVNPKAKEKLGGELRPGTKVVAYTWPLDGWQIEKEDRTPGQPPIYLYTIQ